jgi:ubiquinone/menaquinone biosynthesis C-methylase UbiE
MQKEQDRSTPLVRLISPLGQPLMSRVYSLDMHHEVMLHVLEGEIHLAPVNNPQAILDVGTGTGTVILPTRTYS